MKVFVYGCGILAMDAIRWHFGKNEYIDVTPVLGYFST